MKLILCSIWSSPGQDRELSKLISKEHPHTKVAYVENTHDVYDDKESLIEGRNVLEEKRFDFELVDLRE